MYSYSIYKGGDFNENTYFWFYKIDVDIYLS